MSFLAGFQSEAREACRRLTSSARSPNNEPVRKVIAIATLLAVQLAGLRAPLVHEHPDEHATDHHDGPTVHAHWHGHAPSRHPLEGQTLDAANRDRAAYVNAFLAVAATSFCVLAVTVASIELAAPAERAAYRSVVIAHTHDPPTSGSLSPRAPPFFLS
jgi:hypothetical protein